MFDYQLLISKWCQTQVVYAIGTPTSEVFSQTITKGIISRLEENNGKSKLIQIDASINPGNSGGALVNPKGNLVGIVNAKIVGKGIEGIGFAIPANLIEESLKIEFNKGK
ncbi:MAG: S1C family serine protease [Leadbetterella sp.]